MKDYIFDKTGINAIISLDGPKVKPIVRKHSVSGNYPLSMCFFPVLVFFCWFSFAGFNKYNLEIIELFQQTFWPGKCQLLNW